MKMKVEPEHEIKWYCVSWRNGEMMLGYYRIRANHLEHISQATSWGLELGWAFFDDLSRDEITVVPCDVLTDCKLEKSIDIHNATVEENAVLIRLGLLINVGTKDEGYLAIPYEEVKHD